MHCMQKYFKGLYWLVLLAGMYFKNCIFAPKVLKKKRAASAMQLAFDEQIAPNIYNLCSKKEAKKFEPYLYKWVIFLA